MASGLIWLAGSWVGILLRSVIRVVMLSAWWVRACWAPGMAVFVQQVLRRADGSQADLIRIARCYGRYYPPDPPDTRPELAMFASR